MAGETEFKFEDELENKKDVKKAEEAEEELESDIEVEIEDDTPEEDKGRKPIENVEDPSDEELGEYSEKVAKRIKGLTHKAHDERRAKEERERQLNEASNVIRRQQEQLESYKKRIEDGSTQYKSQSVKLTESELANAERALEVALEAGDTKAVIKAQKELSRATVLHENAKNSTPAPLTEEDDSRNIRTQPQKTTAQVPPIVDAKAAAWRARNLWFGSDHEKTAFALGLHQKLVEAGVDTSSDEYYRRVDSRIAQIFGDSDEEPTPKKSTTPRPKPATVVAPASRISNTKKVVLTQSQVNIANRLGVPLKDYAEQYVLLSKKDQ